MEVLNRFFGGEMTELRMKILSRLDTTLIETAPRVSESMLQTKVEGAYLYRSIVEGTKPCGERANEAFMNRSEDRVRGVSAREGTGDQPADLSVRSLLYHWRYREVVDRPPHPVRFILDTRVPIGRCQLQIASFL
jgi:hypothetical protein